MRAFVVLLSILAACSSDRQLRPHHPQAETPTDPSSSPTVDPETSTTDSGWTPGPTSSSSSTESDTTGLTFPSVPCSLAPDPERLASCAAGPYAALVGSTGYGAVQDAIDAAGSDDEVVVCPGTWKGTLEVGDGKHLEAADPTAGATVIDAGSAGHAISVATDATLVGLTVTGAKNGAIVHSGSHLTLQCDTVAYNDAKYAGGGLVASGEVSVSESMFAYDGARSYGGGIDATPATSLTITDSEFLGDRTDGDGGAIGLDKAITSLARVTFDSNYAGYAGGALSYGDWDDGQIDISDSVFQLNSAGYSGGALTIGTWATDRVSIERSWFTRNTAGYAAGAVEFGSWGGLDAVVFASTFDDNQAPYGGALDVDGWYQDGGTLTLEGATFEDNRSTYADSSAFGVANNAGAIAIVATGITVHRNTGPAGTAAVSLWSDDSLECTTCDFGDGADDNAPVDAIKAGSATAELDADFTL